MGSDQERKLTQTLAEQRSALFVQHSLFYKIFFHLHKGSNFEGLIFIEFKLKELAELFLDFSGKEVVTLLINETKVENSHSEGKIRLPKENLQTEKTNLVIVRFKNSYYNDGNGIHSYINSKGSQFLYTQTEPFYANRVLPIFDQPDLKAQYQVHVAAPSDWKIITTGEEKNVEQWEEFLKMSYGSRFYRVVREEFSVKTSKETQNSKGT